MLRSTPLRRAFVAVLAVVASTVAPPPSLAHSVLKETSPRQGERVTTPLSVIRMTFNETVSAPRVVVRDSRQRRIAGSLSATSSIVEFRPTTVLTGGTVTVTWQVRSRDGHSITGKWSFTLNTPARTTPQSTPKSTQTTTPKRTP